MKYSEMQVGSLKFDMQASKVPPEGTVFSIGPEDLSQLFRVSKSWGLAHPKLEKCHLTLPLSAVRTRCLRTVWGFTRP